MNRLPLAASIAALAIAVVALGVAVLLPGPQGPKGDTGAQGIQGIQGPPSSLVVQRQAGWLRVSKTNGFAITPCHVDLNAGDVLQGYITGVQTNVDYEVRLDSDYGPEVVLGSGYGGTPFCYAANVTGTYIIWVYLADWSAASQYAPWDEYVPVVYWVQPSTTQAK